MNYFVYCITYPDVDIGGITGIEDEKVFTMTYRDMAAVVSRCSEFEYDPTEEHVKKFEDVVKKVMERETVLPMGFGMTFKKEGILKKVLMASEKAIKKSLDELEGKIELGVKILHPQDGLIDSEEIDDIFKRLDEKAESSTEGELFSDRLALNASFLIEENDLDDFSDTVGEIDDEFEDIKIRYTGPWPPFNFVDINIKGSRG